jgi:hypothetical protein
LVVKENDVAVAFRVNANVCLLLLFLFYRRIIISQHIEHVALSICLRLCVQ